MRAGKERSYNFNNFDEAIRFHILCNKNPNERFWSNKYFGFKLLFMKHFEFLIDFISITIFFIDIVIIIFFPCMLICGVVVSFYICNLNHIFFHDECTKQFKQFHLHDNNVFYQRHDDNNNIFNYQQPIYTPNPTSIFSKFHSIKHNANKHFQN